MTASYALTILFSGLVFFIAKKKNEVFSFKIKNVKWFAAALFLAAFFLRLFMGYFEPGFTSDIDTFKSWGQLTNQIGFDLIYQQDIFLDYPPGYLYVLTGLEKLRQILGFSLSSQAYTLLIKMPAILGDLFCAGVLFYVAERRLDKASALLVTAMYLFCPPVLLNSANWGQMDSFCVAVLLLSVMLLYKGYYLPSGAVFGLSIILKPQMLTFVPLFLLFAIRRKSYRSLILAPLTAVGVILLVAAPFTKDLNYWWLIEQYAETMGGYPYYSVNAYNFWALFGKNWHFISDKSAFSFILTAAGPALATLLAVRLVLKAKKDDVIFAVPALLMTVAYLFTVKMHERYIFPILIFILLFYVWAKDRRILYSFSAVTLVHYLNVKYVLQLYQERGGAYDPNEPLVKFFSLIQIIAFFYLLWVIYDICLNGRILKDGEKVTLKEIQGNWKQSGEKIKESLFSGKSGTTVFNKRDLLAAGIITVLYAVPAFWGLGSRQTALTSWTPVSGESVVIQTNHPADVICYIPGLVPDDEHYRAKIGMNVQVEISQDGITWIDQGTLEPSGVLEWKQQQVQELARFFRFTALDDETVINEIGIRNSAWNGYEILTTADGNGQLLMDEQNRVPLYPTYYDSTYFDEIYHARTAYEHILGLEPYENTHPPFGKLLIALGIEIFGMNPFGWRFMGALFGVLMLPLFYYLLKQLTGSLFWSSVGTILFSLDFMHFTQTRIATIDTYAVFFILAMYIAMISFLKKDFLEEKFSTLCRPLLYSGILMGIGIASKWTVAYGAVGLAVLLFAKMGHSLYLAKSERKKECLNRILKMCLWCCLFFILIPFTIYFCAFLPMTTLPHQSSVWGSFINYQTSMYNYHSGLVAEHFFSSAWYEWPFIVKPIWFSFTEDLRYADQISTISSFGNPAVWWVGIPALLLITIDVFRRRNKKAFVVLIGFLSVYLPWVLVPRIAFIYHYFTAVPFLIAAIVLVLQAVLEKSALQKPVWALKGETVLTKGRLLVVGYLLIAFVLAVIFLPVISGAETTRAYADSLEWFSQWYFA